MADKTNQNRSRENSWKPTAKLSLRLVLSCMLLAVCSMGCRSKTPAKVSASKTTAENNAKEALKAEDSEGSLKPAAERVQMDSATSDPADPESNSASEMASVDPAESQDVGTEDTRDLASSDQPPAEAMQGEWTVHRLLALAPTGPRIIELKLSVGGKPLDEMSRAMVEDVGQSLLESLEEEPSWEDLLDVPLVQSGWLGNLVAEEDQVDQLISMYDTERDDVVSLEELVPFLTRGLSRNAALQIRDIGSAPDAQVNESPWGPADLNADHTLDAVEMEGLAQAIEQLDFNGDDLVAQEEIVQGNMADSNQSMNQMSFLETNSLIELPLTDENGDADELAKKQRRVARRIREHYTFLEGVPKEQWSNWSDERWAELDADGDGKLSLTELEQLFTVSPDGMLVLRFPALNVDSEESSGVAGGQFWTMRIGEDGAPQWAESDENPRVEVGDFVAAVSIDDAFGAVGKTRLKEQLGAALKEPQLANFFRQQLGLQDDAFELLDVDENEKLDDREFQSAWRWLTARQGARMLARWMTSARPWFQMLDRDGDRRLNAMELAEGAARMGALDRDGDGLLTPSELPLLVRVEVERTDSRLNVGPFGTPMQTQNEEMPSDWVGAMDTNGDGLISPVEFLGDSEDFGGFDTNKDGFLSRQEVYEAD